MARILDIQQDLLKNIYENLQGYFPELSNDPEFAPGVRTGVNTKLFYYLEYAARNGNAKNASDILIKILERLVQMYREKILKNIDQMHSDVVFDARTSARFESMCLAVLHALNSIDAYVKVNNRVRATYHYHQAMSFLAAMRNVSMGKGYSPPKEKSDVMREVEREMFGYIMRREHTKLG